MKITKRLDTCSSVIYLTYYGRNYTFIFERLRNTQAGHPRFKVFVIKEGYQGCYEYVVTQVYESLKDVALKIIVENMTKLVD